MITTGPRRVLSLAFLLLTAGLTSCEPDPPRPVEEILPTEVEPPEENEVRVIICASGDWQQHVKDSVKHEKLDKDPTVCAVVVGNIVIGDLYMTEKKEGKVAANKAIYKALAKQAAENYKIIPSKKGGVEDMSQRPTVILDADSAVPYEHIIGAVNAIKKAGVDDIEFVGNPRLDAYYGSDQKGKLKK